MHPANYYRKQAAHAQTLADMSQEGAVHEVLVRLVQDYGDIAEDLETGAIDIRHPELLPQKNRKID